MEWPLLRSLLLALGLGLLVGLERERAHAAMAGVRTFALIGLAGALAAVAGGDGPWLPAAGLLGVVALFWVANRVGPVVEPGSTESVTGLTTEMAGIVVFLVGVVAVRGPVELAVVVAGATAVLLHWKEPLHAFVRRLGEDEVRAVLRLVLLAMVVLPVLPDRAYGPYEVLNPSHIWLMVVLIVGISLAAWVIRRLLGPGRGALVAGVLGGLVSSTATTVGVARRSKEEPALATGGSVVILAASAVVFARVLLEVGIVAPRALPTVGPPLVGVGLVLAGLLWLGYRRDRDALEADPEAEAPDDLGAAVAFGLLYAVVLFAVAAVKDRFGDGALYAVAALSGVADVDAITLSTARLLELGRLDLAVGGRLILVATLANLVFKGLLVAILGRRALLARLTVPLGLTVAAGAAVLLLL